MLLLFFSFSFRFAFCCCSEVIYRSLAVSLLSLLVFFVFYTLFHTFFDPILCILYTFALFRTFVVALFDYVGNETIISSTKTFAIDDEDKRTNEGEIMQGDLIFYAFENVSTRLFVCLFVCCLLCATLLNDDNDDDDDVDDRGGRRRIKWR